MDIHPLDLILAAALSWATIFLGALSTQLLRLSVGIRAAAWVGAGWLVVAAIVPVSIVHCYIFIALLCFYASWQLREDNALSGKGWLCLAAGLGVSVGVVLIMAMTPALDLSAWPLWRKALLLASIHLLGGVLGLAGVVYILTRPAATAAGLPASLVAGYARILFGLICALGLVLAAGFIAVPTLRANVLLVAGSGILLLALLILGWLALRRVRSPAPSMSAFALAGILVAGTALAEIMLLNMMR